MIEALGLVDEAVKVNWTEAEAKKLFKDEDGMKFMIILVTVVLL